MKACVAVANGHASGGTFQILQLASSVEETRRDSGRECVVSEAEAGSSGH